MERLEIEAQIVTSTLSAGRVSLRATGGGSIRTALTEAGFKAGDAVNIVLLHRPVGEETCLVCCPFCKGNQTELISNGQINYVRCTHCSSEGPLVDDPEGARSAWNRSAIVIPKPNRALDKE